MNQSKKTPMSKMNSEQFISEVENSWSGKVVSHLYR